MSSDLLGTTASLFEAAQTLYPLVLLFTGIGLLNLISHFEVITAIIQVWASGQNSIKPW